MMASVLRPWAWSLGLHLVLATFFLVWWASVPLVQPPVVRMRLVGPLATSGNAVPQLGNWWKGPQRAAASQAEPQSPPWREPAITSVGGVLDPTVPFHLEELLAGVVVVSDPEPRASMGWSSGGEGYALPPLPPPQLAPPQGARWVLTLGVPGAGGFATVDGLDSGHPELDRWLETYLRTVVFPPSLDGQDYQLRWTLSLESGRPE